MTQKTLMKTIRSTALATLCAVCLLGVARADSITLTVDPSNSTGAAGTTVGWGFTLTNTTTDLFAVVTGSDFCTGVVSSPCVNPLGTYTDLIGQQFLVVGPGSVSQVFNNTLGTGLGSFLINAGAASITQTGTFFVTYDLFSQDPTSPNFDPNSLVAPGNSVSASSSISVSPVPVPEPESAAMALVAVLMTLLFAKTRWGRQLLARQ